MTDHKIPPACRPALQHWLKALYYSIAEMGQRHTNPVRLILGNIKTVKPFQHYPQQAYCFGDNFWRAYYHSHHSPLNLEQEHGHLHFFSRNHAQGDWAHCFALSINPLGQPVYMFTTNLWVTRGEWFDATRLMQALYHLELDAPNSVIIQWFRAFILAFQDDIHHLLAKRDEALSTYCRGDIRHCGEDRSLYQLSILPVHLEVKLSHLLNPAHIAKKSHAHS